MDYSEIEIDECPILNHQDKTPTKSSFTLKYSNISSENNIANEGTIKRVNQTAMNKRPPSYTNIDKSTTDTTDSYGHNKHNYSPSIKAKRVLFTNSQNIQEGNSGSLLVHPVNSMAAFNSHTIQSKIEAKSPTKYRNTYMGVPNEKQKLFKSPIQIPSGRLFLSWEERIATLDECAMRIYKLDSMQTPYMIINFKVSLNKVMLSNTRIL